MKFYLWSDVHNDFGTLYFKPELYNKEYPLIIAGDWGTATEKNLVTLQELCDFFNDVIFVPGNHDYYGGDIETVDTDYKNFSIENPNFHFLNSKTVEIGEYNFIGCTLWTDLDQRSEYLIKSAHRILNDFRYIEDFGWKYHYVNNWLKLNDKHVQFILDNIKPNKKNIIVTHHAPSEICVEDRFRNNSINGFYHCNNRFIDDLFHEKKIDGWVHGHMHVQGIVHFNDIPIFRNARGYHYYEETADKWEPNKVFEII